MKFSRRLSLALIALMLVVAMLALPMTASAEGAFHGRATLDVPADLESPVTLTVGRISVTIPPGAMPEGGTISLRVVETPSGRFVAEFLPDLDFEVAVTMDYATAPWVDYMTKKGPQRMWTENGKIQSYHFSRYSGWF